MSAIGDGPRPMIGRQAELARVRTALEAAVEGTPSIVLIDGETGIGKTRLVEELAAEAASRGAAVLAGSCPPIAGRDLPLAPIVSVIRTLARDAVGDDAAALAPAREALATLVPALASPGDRQAAARPAAQVPATLGLVFEHLLAVLERLADRRPAVLLVLEDMHWAAPTTWDFVAYLARNLVRSRVLVACTYRQDPLLGDPRDALLLSELRRLPVVATLRLDRLQNDDAVALAAAVAPGRPPAELAAIASRAGGNPYLIGQLAGSAEGALPPGVRATVEARIAVLPDPVLRVLRVAALIGRPCDADLLIEAVGDPEEATIAAIRESVRAGLLGVAGDGGDGYRFRQEVERQVVADTLLPGERTRIHGRIARSLARQLASGEAGAERVIELATHWRASGDPIRAVPALLRGAAAAEKLFGFAEASRMYEQAFTMAEGATQSDVPVIGFRPRTEAPRDRWDAGPEWAGLFARAAEAASLAGNAERAIELVDAALAHAGATRGDAQVWQRRRARYLMEAGRAGDAIDAYAALEARGDDLTRTDLTRVRLAHAQALLSLGRYSDAVAMARRALDEVGDDLTLAWQGLQVAGSALVLEGDTIAGLDAIGRARAIAGTRTMASVVRQQPTRIGEVLSAQRDAVRALGRSGAPDDAAAIAVAAAGAAGAVGAVRWQAELDLAGGWLALGRGDWDAAAAAAERTLSNPDARAIRHVARTLRGHVLARRGSFPEAERDLAEAAGAVEVVGRAEDVGRLRLAEAELGMWRRRYNDAASASEAGMNALGATDERQLRAELCLAAIRADVELHADAMLRRGASEALDLVGRVGQLLAELQALAGAGSERSGPEIPERSTAGPGDRVARLLAIGRAEASRAGPPDLAAWQAGVTAATDLRDPYALALVQWRHAEALLGVREGRPAATATLQAAHVAAVALGAGPLRDELEGLATRARIELGVDHVVSTSPSSTSAADLGLSEREVEVLLLVARGRTNRQIAEELFITEKTAGHHVSNILSKLDVANRLEAAAIAHRAGLLDNPNDHGPR